MPPFAGTARDGVLHAIAGEDLQPAVIELHRDVDGDLLGGRAQNLAHAVVKVEALGSFVETHFGGDPGILFLLERESGGPTESSGFIMTNSLILPLTCYGGLAKPPTPDPGNSLYCS